MGWCRRILVLATVALGLVTLSSRAHAQVNAEQLRSQLQKTPTFLWLDGSLSSRAGNSAGITLSASAFGGVTRPPHVFFAKASSDYGTDNHNAPIVAKSLVHARYNYMTTPFVFLEVLAQVQHDRFRRLAVRDLYGTGLRFNWIRHPKFELFSGNTILLEQQTIIPMDPYPGRSDVWVRSSNYLGLNIALWDIGTLTSVSYVQPRIVRPKDVRVLHETDLSFGITKRLAATITANLIYDSEPPGGVLRADFELKNSVTVKF